MMGNQSSVVGRQSSDSVVGRWPLVLGQSLLASGCLLLSVSALAQQKTVVLKGGKLLTVSHGVIENGVLVMSGGKITALRRGRIGDDSQRMRKSSMSPG